MEDPPIKVMLELDRDCFSILDFLFRIIEIQPNESLIGYNNYMKIHGKLYNLYTIYKKFEYDKKIVAAIKDPSLFPEVLYCHYAFYPAYIFLARSFKSAFNLLVKVIYKYKYFRSIIYYFYYELNFDLLYLIKFPLIQNVIYTRALNKYIRTLKNPEIKKIAKKVYYSMKRVQETYIQLLKESNIEKLNSKYYTIHRLIKISKENNADVTRFIKRLSTKLLAVAEKRDIKFFKNKLLEETWEEELVPFFEIENGIKIMSRKENIFNYKRFQFRSLCPFLERCVYPFSRNTVIKDVEDIIPDISREQINTNTDFYCMSDYYTRTDNLKRLKHTNLLLAPKSNQESKKYDKKELHNKSLSSFKNIPLSYNFQNETTILTRDFHDIDGNVNFTKTQKARKEQKEKVLAYLMKLRKKYEKGYIVTKSELNRNHFYLTNFSRIADDKWNNGDLKDISFLIWLCKNCLTVSFNEIIQCGFCKINEKTWRIRKFHVNYRTLKTYLKYAKTSLLTLTGDLIENLINKNKSIEYLKGKEFDDKTFKIRKQNEINYLLKSISEISQQSRHDSSKLSEIRTNISMQKETNEQLKESIRNEKNLNFEYRNKQNKLLRNVENKINDAQMKISLILNDKKEVVEELGKSIHEMTNIYEVYTTLKNKKYELEGEFKRTTQYITLLKEDTTFQSENLIKSDLLFAKQCSKLLKTDKNLQIINNDKEKLLGRMAKLKKENELINSGLIFKEDTMADMTKRFDAEKREILEERKRISSNLQKDIEIHKKRVFVARSKFNKEQNHFNKLRLNSERLVADNKLMKESMKKLSSAFLHHKNLLKKRKKDSEKSLREISAIKNRTIKVLFYLQFLVLLILLMGYFNVFPFSEKEEWINFASSFGMWEFLS